MTEQTEPTTDQLESHAKLLELKISAFSLVLEHAKDVLIDKVSLEAAAFRVNAHNMYVQILNALKHELDEVKGLLAKKAEPVAPPVVSEVTTPEPTHAPIIGSGNGKVGPGMDKY